MYALSPSGLRLFPSLLLIWVGTAGLVCEVEASGSISSSAADLSSSPSLGGSALVLAEKDLLCFSMYGLMEESLDLVRESELSCSSEEVAPLDKASL